ncbi:MAG TPA: alpha/beta hydrolase [Stellaceae bacterium]|jgi:acetyl esterase/lipase|nr:alpha/beta hydrolase [Stellaceae bacterium]
MSLENQALTWALRRWIKRNSLRNQDVVESRALTARVPFRAKLARGWRIRGEHGVTLKGEWIEPVAPNHAARRRCILYLHGGAYVAMSPRTHRSVTSRLAIWSNASSFVLDYRLAPEHPFPAALADAVAAYRALIAGGVSPSQIVLAGDSAGGGLALALLLALRDGHDPLPAAAVLFSPWTDLAATGASIVANNASDAMFFGSWVAREARHYLGDTPATNPLASPVYADLTGLPPLFIQVGDSEILLDDSRRVFENAKKVGVEATLQIWRGVPHGWQIFAPVLPEGRAALRQASAFIAARLALDRSAQPKIAGDKQDHDDDADNSEKIHLAAPTG